MKVTIKRRTATTVPRKLELVNVRCVETSASHGGRPMIVSQSRAASQTSLLPLCGGAGAPPPFWELEDLIARGFAHETALAIMAARRAGQDDTIRSSDMHAPQMPEQPARNESLTILLSGG